MTIVQKISAVNDEKQQLKQFIVNSNGNDMIELSGYATQISCYFDNIDNVLKGIIDE